MRAAFLLAAALVAASAAEPLPALANLPALWASRGQSRHRNDGLVFLRDTSQITSGTDHTMYKFKEEHTIDVKFVGRADQSMPSQLLLLRRPSRRSGISASRLTSIRARRR